MHVAENKISNHFNRQEIYTPSLETIIETFYFLQPSPLLLSFLVLRKLDHITVFAIQVGVAAQFSLFSFIALNSSPPLTLMMPSL